ncbi:tyrosine-protein kinase HTK16-like, partial [Amphibalanus amphitrite]|uniref:tyrosine-protein kinase HTK16-like n=1 Tax=Amphibalanus amphitrite TaxID=1232801 RepID=UPI001C9266BA
HVPPSDKGTVIHGLDELVNHYRTANDGLAVPLAGHLLGRPPPPSCLLRGASSNLLHRATEEGSLKVVSELLKAGYQGTQFKDAQGQTALHLAARLRREEILPLLLEYHCSPDVRDSHGLLPLHYAARENYAQGVRQLVEAGSSLQARSSELNWVPLHEAANSGAIDALKTLLALDAPCRPRDCSNRTPEDLARAAGHTDCVEVLVRYKPPMPRRMRSEWLHGAMSRSEAEQKLRAGGFNTGDYLLRTSTRKNSTVLSMVSDDKVFHFEIRECRLEGELRFVFIDDGPYLDSLEHLVEHYSSVADGLQCRLLHPLPPSAEDAHRAITDNRREVLGPPPLPLPRLLLSPGTIAADDLEFGAPIGDGEFGKVYQGRWRDPRGRQVDVAIKTSHGMDRTELLREASCLKDLRHRCIVRFLGMLEHEPLMLVQELVALGSLLDYLKQQPHDVSMDDDFKLWAGQVAEGMEYLEKQRMVHRDLAARNILVASHSQVKISDFGFSRPLGDRDYYVASEGGRWPVKWYAPEAMNFGRFTAASDVWSFGVLLWEMFSYGEQPYGDMPGVDAFVNVVEKGHRLQKPEYCPGGIYEVMLKCWAYEPHERPSFSILHQFFSADNEYRNLSELGVPQCVSLTAEANQLPSHRDTVVNGLPVDVAVAAETVAAAAAEELLAVTPPVSPAPSPPPLPVTAPPSAAAAPAPVAEKCGTPPRPSALPQTAASAAAPPWEVSTAPNTSSSITSPKPSIPPHLPRKPLMSVFLPKTSTSPDSQTPATKPNPITPSSVLVDVTPNPSESSPPDSRPPTVPPFESPATEPTDVYDVLSAASSAPPKARGERPPVPPKPALMVRRRPTLHDDLLYDSPRSHNLQRLRSDSAPPAVLAAALSAVSIPTPEEPGPPGSMENITTPSRPEEPAAPPSEREQESAPPPLSPYSLLGSCGGSDTYDVPTSPMLSPAISVLSQEESELYDVPTSPRRSAAADSRS